MPRGDAAALQQCHPQSSRQRGLYSHQIGAFVSDAPAACSAFERVNRAVAVDAALRKGHQGHRFGAGGQGWRARDPVQVFPPGRQGRPGAGFALEQRQIQVAPFQAAGQGHGQVAAHRQPDARPGAGELRHDGRERVGGEIVGNAQPDHLDPLAAADRLAHFGGQRQHAARIAEQAFAVLGQVDLAAFAHEQRAFEGLLEFADLLADGGLAAVHPFAGAGEAARVDDGDKAVQ